MKTNKLIICGCKPSGYSDRDVEYTQIMDLNVIRHYDTHNASDVINQGADGSCVSQCLFEMLRYNSETWNRGKCTIDRTWVYDRRQNKAVEGMTPREGLEILRSSQHIQTYARIPSIVAAKSAIMACGPILIALPVYNATDEFWLGDGRPVGYHAVTATAFDEDGFTFKNSWGADWNAGGYGHLPVENFNEVIESWVIIA